jgi:hypothetical protein
MISFIFLGIQNLSCDIIPTNGQILPRQGHSSTPICHQYEDGKLTCKMLIFGGQTSESFANEAYWFDQSEYKIKHCKYLI